MAHNGDSSRNRITNFFVYISVCIFRINCNATDGRCMARSFRKKIIEVAKRSYYSENKIGYL